jgi:hypothetical protein
VVVVVMVVLMLVIIVIVVVAAAIGIVALVVVVVMMMVMLVLVIVVIVMVAAAIGIVTLVVIVVVMVVVMLMLVIVVVVMMAAAVGIVTLVVVVVVMVVMMLGFSLQSRQLLFHRLATLGGSQNLLAVQLIPGRGHDDGGGVLLAQHFHAGGDLLIVQILGVAEHDAAGTGDLVVEKLAEILHIHFSLLGIDHGGEAAKDSALGVRTLHRADDVGQLTDARRLDQNTVGRKITDDLGQRLAEVADKRTTNAAGVHLGDLHPRLAQKAAVNTDLSEFVLDQHQLLAAVGLAKQLFDQRRLARTEKSGENINFSHNEYVLSHYKIIQCIFYAFFRKKSTISEQKQQNFKKYLRNNKIFTICSSCVHNFVVIYSVSKKECSKWVFGACVKGTKPR